MKPLTQRIITWPGAYNMRWITERYIRSASLNLLNKVGWKQLVASGITTIIDLRNKDEVYSSGDLPSAYVAPIPVTVISIPFFSTWDTSGSVHAMAKSRGHEYFLWLEKFSGSILSVLSAIATADGKTIFHCQTGTDRTGVIAALLLANAGVDINTIVSDYAASHQLMVDFGTTIGEDWSGMPASKSETMLEMLRNVESRYGSVGNYLQHIGVTDDLRKRLAR